MFPPNKGVAFGCQYSKLLAVQVSVCDGCFFFCLVFFGERCCGQFVDRGKVVPAGDLA